MIVQNYVSLTVVHSLDAWISTVVCQSCTLFIRVEQFKLKINSAVLLVPIFRQVERWVE